MTEIKVYEDLILLKGIFEAFIINNIDDECVEYESEQVHEIVERMIAVLKQYEFTHNVGDGDD